MRKQKCWSGIYNEEWRRKSDEENMYNAGSHAIAIAAVCYCLGRRIGKL